METFKVFGKLKRKELSFGFNDVRGVNKREERLLRSALGSLEKQRKRSLLNIQNKVADLHITLKETNNIWQGDKHLVHEEVEMKAPRCQTPINSDKKAEKQNRIKENLQETSNHKEMPEPSGQDPLVPKSSLQYVNMSSANTTKTNERILRRPRNTSTGSKPRNLHHENTHSVLDLNLRKTASSSDVDKLITGTGTKLMHTGAATLIIDEGSEDKIFYRREPHQRSVSSDNITCSSEKLPTAPFFGPQLRQKKLSADLGSLESFSFSSRDSPVLTRKMGTARSFNSFGNASAGSIPIPTRRATVADRRVCRSAVGHKPVTRMISCPQLNCTQKTNDYRTLSSISWAERSLSHMSTELPELMAGLKIHDDKREEAEQSYRCVSPTNLERTMMDKHLQDRINAFLNSLAENEQSEAGTSVDDIE